MGQTSSSAFLASTNKMQRAMDGFTTLYNLHHRRRCSKTNQTLALPRRWFFLPRPRSRESSEREGGLLLVLLLYIYGGQDCNSLFLRAREMTLSGDCYARLKCGRGRRLSGEMAPSCEIEMALSRDGHQGRGFSRKTAVERDGSVHNWLALEGRVALPRPCRDSGGRGTSRTRHRLARTTSSSCCPASSSRTRAPATTTCPPSCRWMRRVATPRASRRVRRPQIPLCDAR